MISPSCYLIEVYLIDDVNFNLMSISQLCDAVFLVLFNDVKCTISNLAKNITIIGDRVEKIYVLNNGNLSCHVSSLLLERGRYSKTVSGPMRIIGLADY